MSYLRKTNTCRSAFTEKKEMQLQLYIRHMCFICKPYLDV